MRKKSSVVLQPHLMETLLGCDTAETAAFSSISRIHFKAQFTPNLEIILVSQEAPHSPNESMTSHC